MARTAIHVTPLVANSSVAYAAGTNIDATNGMYVPASAGRSDELFLRVTNTYDGAKTITIKAGAFDMSGLGDLAVSVADGDPTAQTVLVGPFTSARFLQADGTIYVDPATGMTGTVEVYTVPRNA